MLRRPGPLRSGHVIAIPESGSVVHVKEYAVILSLTPRELQTLGAAHSIRAAHVLRSLLDRGSGWLRSFQSAQ